MRAAFRFRHLLPAASLVVTSLDAACAASPPASAADPMPEMKLWLELVINNAETGQVVPVTARAGHYLLRAEDLRRAGLLLDETLNGAIDTASLAGAETRYDEAAQRLLLRVPDDMLPRQVVGRESRVARMKPQSSLGALLNYDLYLSGTERGDRSLSFWNEARLFGSFGVIRNTGTYRTGLSGKRAGDGYIRFDTNWTFVDEDRIRTYELGDIVTRTLAWTSPVRLGGAQLSRDFTVRPDIVTYPLPVFSGAAQVPTSVDLFINGYRTSSDSLQPGPFTLMDIPYVNGAGEAVVVTTDAHGRQVNLAIPFYVATTLLRPGLSDYAFSIGKLRRNYGTRNLSYGATAVSAAWRHGLTNGFTAELTAQRAGSLSLAGAGGIVRLGNLGVMESSLAWSWDGDRSGRQFTIGYQYNGRRFNVMARHIRRSRDFSDLASYDVASFDLARRQTQVRANIVLPGKFGTIGAGYLESSQRDERFRIADLSYYQPLGPCSLYLTVGRDFSRHTTTAMAQLIVPLGGRGTVVAGMERTSTGAIRERIDYNRTVPSDGGLGWSLTGRTGSKEPTTFQGNLAWRTQAMQLQAGLYGPDGSRTWWGDLSGSIVVMDGGLFATNRINDAFALVSTDGLANVPVRYENQRIGVTNRNGHLLIPWAPAYYGAKYEIDPLDLPAVVATPVVEQRAAVKLGSGRTIRFPIRHLSAANIVLHDRHGEPLKPGTRILVDGGESTYVGYDGIAYLEDLKETNRLTAELADGSSCSVTFPFRGPDAGITRIGPLQCW